MLHYIVAIHIENRIRKRLKLYNNNNIVPSMHVCRLYFCSQKHICCILYDVTITVTAISFFIHINICCLDSERNVWVVPWSIIIQATSTLIKTKLISPCLCVLWIALSTVARKDWIKRTSPIILVWWPSPLNHNHMTIISICDCHMIVMTILHLLLRETKVLSLEGEIHKMHVISGVICKQANSCHFWRVTSEIW